MNKKKIKTLTIKSESVESLESDESKLDFVNSVIAVLTDHKKVDGKSVETLKEGLNDDLPEPFEGSPEFDSSNMTAAEFKRYSMVRSGFFPVTLNCGYDDYKYKHRDDFTRDKLIDMYGDVGTKKSRSKGKRDYLDFLNYIQQVLDWHLKK